MEGLIRVYETSVSCSSCLPWNISCGICSLHSHKNNHPKFSGSQKEDGVHSHHPTPTGLYPCHSPKLEVRRRAEFLISDGRNGDGGRVGLIDGDRLVVIEGADLPIGDVWQVFLTNSGLGLWRQLVNADGCFVDRLRLVLFRCRYGRHTRDMTIFPSFVKE